MIFFEDELCVPRTTEKADCVALMLTSGGPRGSADIQKDRLFSSLSNTTEDRGYITVRFFS